MKKHFIHKSQLFILLSVLAMIALINERHVSAQPIPMYPQYRPMQKILYGHINGMFATNNLIIRNSIIRSAIEKRGKLQNSNNSKSKHKIQPNDLNQSYAISDDYIPYNSRTAFVPVTKSLVPQMIASELGKDASVEERKQLEGTLVEALNVYNGSLESNDYRPYDVANATAYFILNNVKVYQGDDNQSSIMTFNMLHKQISDMLSQNKEFRNFTNKDKQMLYETFGIFGGLVRGGYNIASVTGNKEGVKMFRELAKSNLETFLKVPADKIRVTEQGLVILN
jgi:hypothetical protein